jgi:hypothetical protein
VTADVHLFLVMPQSVQQNNILVPPSLFVTTVPHPTMSTLNDSVLDHEFGLQSQSDKDSTFKVGDLVYSEWSENGGKYKCTV